MKFRLKPIAAALVMLAMTQNAQAVDVAAGDLDAALSGLAKETGIQILFDANEIKGAKTSGVHGAATAEDALKQLLQNSGYSYQSTGANAFVIRVPHRAKEASLDEIVVTATKTERSRDEVPVAMSVVTSKQIENKVVLDLTDVLLGQAGLDVARSNPNGLGGISIRGLGSYAHALIMIDGQPADLMSYSGKSPLQIIDPANVERVEIVRGAASALYGSNAMSGVVNIITKHGKGDGKTRVAVGYDSMNSPLVKLNTNGANGDFTYNLSLRHARTKGYNIFPDAAIAWAQTTLNSDWGDDSIAAKFGYLVQPGTEISLGLNYQDSFSHTRGWDNQAFYKQHFDTVEVRHQVNDIYQVIANLSYRKHTAHYLWGYTPGVGSSDENTDKTRIDIQNQFDFSEANRLIAGLDYGVESVNWVSMNGPNVLSDTQSSKTGNLGVYLQDELKPTDKLFVTIGGRFDSFNYSKSQFVNYNVAPALVSSGNGNQSVFNPRLGAKLEVADATWVRGSAGTGFRPPNASDKYRNTPWTLGNPNLKPEHSTSYDVGIDHKFGSGASISATLFYINLKDAITWFAQANGLWQPNNVSQANSKGLELELSQPINENWLVNFNYTNTNTRITQQTNNPALVGNQLAYAPQNKASVGLVYDIPKQFAFRIDGRYTGSQHAGLPNAPANMIGGYFLTDLKATWHASGNGDGFDVSAGVSNLANRTYYRFQPYWHEPGRVVSVEAGYKW